ncbi:MAG: phosphoribosylanthranilate isomerase [Anaerolineae bacterium]
MVHVKICGLTTFEDALIAAGAGADLLGFNFYPPSPRYISPAACRQITDALRDQLGSACPILVGVFVNAPDVAAIMAQAGVDVAQLHGDEPPEAVTALAGRVFKAIRPRSVKALEELVAAYALYGANDERLPSLLVDAHHPDLYGGTGQQTSLSIALTARARVPRLMLAGGLTPDNVAAQIRAVRPWGVDVASGVEGTQKGRKDPAAIRAFMAAVKTAGSRRPGNGP